MSFSLRLCLLLLLLCCGGGAPAIGGGGGGGAPGVTRSEDGDQPPPVFLLLSAMADLQSLRISAVFFPTDDRRLAPDAMPLFPLATEAERSLVPNQLHESLPPS